MKTPAADNPLIRESVGHQLLYGIVSYLKRNAGILLGLLVLCVIISISNPVFLTPLNQLNVLRQISSNMYLACGMTMVMISGGIDLSVGAIIGVIGVIGATLIENGMPLPLVLVICLAAGCCFGAISGFIISRTTIPAFIVTFSMMSVLRGLAYVYTGGVTARITNKDYINLGTGYIGFLPLPVFYMLIILLVVWLILAKSKFGRHLYALGGNEKAAKFSGIDTKNVRLLVYIFSGLMAAIAGIVLSARSYSGNPVAGDSAEMDAIAACALGGISMNGGIGFLGGTIIGALIIGFLSNGLNLMHIDSFWQTILKGIVILVAVYVDYVKGQLKNKKAA